MATDPRETVRERRGADLDVRVREPLARTSIMTLSAVGPDGPWTSPVQYDDHND